MSGKLAIGGLVAVAAMALSAGSASAQYVVQHGNHFHNVGPAYGFGGGHYHGGGFAPAFQPVYQPIYRPVYQPAVFPAYNSGFGFNSPLYGGYNSGFGFGNQWGGGFGPGIGIGYSNGFGGRPSVGLSFNFVR